jgi:hypothetical protein
MSFQDLPDDLSSRPLTDPRFVADVLDLCVTEASRTAGGLYLLLCDTDDRLVQPVAIDDVPPDCGVQDCERLLGTFAGMLAELREGYALMVAIARPGDPQPTPADLRWLSVAQRVCRRTAVRLVGVHVVTPTGQHKLTADLSAA